MFCAGFVLHCQHANWGTTSRNLNLRIPYMDACVFVYVGVTQGEEVMLNDSQKYWRTRQKNIFQEPDYAVTPQALNCPLMALCLQLIYEFYWSAF